MSRIAMATRSERPRTTSRQSIRTEVAARLRPAHSGNLATETSLIAYCYSRVRGLAGEIWQIARWLALWCIGQAIYFVGGRTDRTESTVIRIGNVIFRRVYSLERFADFQSYSSLSECRLKQYFELFPRDRWLEKKHVLDLGAGLGQYSHALLTHGAKRVVGLEYQAEKASWAEARFAAPQLSFVAGSAECMPFPSQSFDTIFSHTVFEHIADVQAALHEVRRVLKPSGLALLSYNFFHHRGGHHLFPYVHFPWATWVVREETLCRYWSEQLARDQRNGGMRFFPVDSAVNSLSEGAEIHLNKHTFEDFEAMLPQAGLRIVKRASSEELVRLLPVLERIPHLHRFLVGTIYYVLQPANGTETSGKLNTSCAASLD